MDNNNTGAVVAGGIIGALIAGIPGLLIGAVALPVITSTINRH